MIRLADCIYASQIRAAMTAYIPQWPWEHGAAQLYQESAWNPKAMSPTGAMGLAQFLPGTWNDECIKLGYPETASAFDPTYAIPAFADYMKWLRGEWSHVPRSEDERRKLAQASYNAGLGNLLAAQKWLVSTGGNYNDALSIIAALQHVTNTAVSNQAAQYVLGCAKWFGQLSTNNGVTK